MGILDTLRHKMELYRLEQRYTRRDKRTTFASGAQYVDGEYVYPESPSSGTSSATWGNNTIASASSGHGEEEMQHQHQHQEMQHRHQQRGVEQEHREEHEGSLRIKSPRLGRSEGSFWKR